MPSDLTLILRSIAALGVDYVRWTQMVPMIFGWTFLILGIGILGALGFQTDIDAALQAAAANPEGAGFLIRGIEALFVRLEEGPGLTWERFSGWVMGGWAIASLLLMLLSGVMRQLRGPRPPVALARRAVWSLGALAIVWLILVLLIAGPLSTPGQTGASLLIATLWCVVVFGLTVWALLVGEVLGKVRDLIDPSRATPPPPPPPPVPT